VSDAQTMTPRDRLWLAISAWAYALRYEYAHRVPERKAAVDAAIDALLAAPSPLAAPVSEEEGSEGRAAVSDCAKTMPGNPVAWCHRPEGHGGRCEFVFSTTVSPYRAPAPPPSTGDAPGPSEECHVEGCGWRWPRGSGLGCPQHPSPRAQTGTDEGVSEEQLAEWERLVAGAWAAPWVAHTFEIDCPCPNGEHCGDSHTCEEVEAPAAYPASPEDPAPAGEGQCVVQISVPGLESLARPTAEFIAAARTAVPALVAEVRRLRSAALRREERDPRLAALEEAARVVDGLAAHTSREDEEQRAWLYAYAKAAAAIRALSSPATNPEPETKETR
jgi:hypothetical protein